MKVESLSKLDSASKRLKFVIEALGVKQSRMAAKLGLSPSGLHYILNNEIKFSKNAKKIAEYLNVNESWLSSGEGEIYKENTSIKTYKVPVYYPDQLTLSLRLQAKISCDPSSFLLTTKEYERQVLGVYVTDDSFYPKFEIGDTVAFECVEEFVDGEILLVYFGKVNTVLIKKGIHIENNIYFLTSFDGPIVKFSPEQGDIIIGRYRECHKKSNIA